MSNIQKYNNKIKQNIMKNTKFWTLIILIIFLFGSFGAYFISSLTSGTTDLQLENKEIEITSPTQEEEDDESVLVFYSSTCPHCEIVKKYLKDNAENLTLTVKTLKIDDPKTDKDNLALALKKAQECNLGENWGVPLMYYAGDCLMGDQPIIDYLNQKKSN